MRAVVDVAATEQSEELVRRLRRQWLRWGLLPTLSVCLLALAASAVQAAPADLSPRQMELRIQLVMAIAAAAFLTGFWLEGYCTAVDKLLRALARRRGLDLSKIEPAQLKLAAGDAADIIRSAHSSALIIGWALAVLPLVQAFFRCGIGHVAIVSLMALCYQGYLLSRHHHYMEAFEGIASGALASHARELVRAKRRPKAAAVSAANPPRHRRRPR